MTKRKNTKKALILSCLSLLLCVSMLVGTTFAWFTDNSAVSVNTVQAGTLRIDLIDATSKESLEGKMLEFKKAAGAPEGEKILWEPGATYELQDMKIVNKGNLALKYQLVITGINGNAKLNDAIDWTISFGENTVDLKNATFKLAPNAESDALTIKGTMKTTAGNEYQGLAIDGIAIAVQATQDTVEYDSNNNTYDENATYGEDYVAGGDGTTADTNVMQTIEINNTEEFVVFANAVTDGTSYKDVKVHNNRNVTVKLNADIDLTDAVGSTATANQVCIGNGGNTRFDGILDGQNHTISNLSNNGNWTYTTSLFRSVGDGFTLKNITFDGIQNTVEGRKTSAVGAIAGICGGGQITFTNVTVKNANVNGRAAVGILLGKAQQTTVLVAQNCVLEDCVASISSHSNAQPNTLGALVGSFEDFGLNGNAPANWILVNNTITNCVDGEGNALPQAGSAY